MPLYLETRGVLSVVMIVSSAGSVFTPLLITTSYLLSSAQGIDEVKI